MCPRLGDAVAPTTMRFFLRLLFRIVLRVRVVGDLTPFAQANRLLIVANHGSRLDALALALFLPRSPLVVVPPEEAQLGWLGRLLKPVAHLEGGFSAWKKAGAPVGERPKKD